MAASVPGSLFNACICRWPATGPERRTPMIRRMTACLLLIVAGTGACRAGVRVGIGIADEIDGMTAPAATVSWSSAQRHPWELVGGWVRGRNGATMPDAFFVGAGRRLSWRRWSVSGGVAWVSVDNDVLSGHGQFLTGVAYDVGRMRLGLRHLSNASTNGRNRGETLLLLEVAF